MLLSTLGSSGIGLVWGWLVGAVDEPLRRPIRNVLAITAATLAISGFLLWRAGWQALPFFGGAALLAFLLHLGWRQELRTRSGPANFEVKKG